MSPSVSHPEARRKRGLPRRSCVRVVAGAVLAGLAAIAGAQTTTAPSTPGTGAPSQPSAPHGGGVGVGVGIDLGGLIRGLQGKKDEPAASTPAQIQPPAGKVVASPQTVVAPGQSLASAAKTPAPPPNQFDEMQRSTVVFRGATVDPAAAGPCVDKSVFRHVADDVGRQILDTGRFDALEVDDAAAKTPEQFVKAVQDQLLGKDTEQTLRIAKDRLESRGEEYDFRYGETVITGDAMRQVWGSVYGYEVHIGAPVVTAVDTPQGRRFIATVPVTVKFYRLGVVGDDDKTVPAGQAVQTVAGGQIRFNLNGSGAADPCDAVKRALLYGSAAIADQVQAIPEFQSIGTVIEVLDDNRVVTMRPGAREGVRVGDQYDIYDRTKDGRKVLVGRAVVESVGTGLVAAGMGASKADVTENRTHLRVTQLQPGYDPADLRGSTLGPRP